MHPEVMPPPFVNNYTPPPPAPLCDPLAALSSSEPYDINFAFSIHTATLTSERVRLTPFVPRLHARAFWHAVEPHLDALFRYYPYVLRTLPEFLAKMETYRREPEWCMFMVIDRTKPARKDGSEEAEDGVLAGMMSLVNTSGVHFRTEIAFVMIFPEFHHTHVARTAASLLLRYCLQPPTASPPGLGFRRVQWCAHPKNAPSLGLAKKLGFKEEGLLRYMWTLAEVEILMKEACEVRRKDEASGEQRTEGWARSSVVLSCCWDDWEEGIRELTNAIIRS